MNFKHYIPALFLLLAGCSKPSDEIIIATAANVQYVMQDIKKEFEKETGKPVEIVVSSSGKLTTQIREGAPFDVFVSADMKYPQEIYKKGGSEEAPRVYAYGELVLWAKDIPAAQLSSEILMSEKIKKIAIPNPRFAPYGEAAIQVLEKQKSYAEIKNKLVYGESIAQTAQYISSGSVEAGFNALSIVLSPEMKGKGNWVVVDSSLYQPIAQGAILLRHSENSPKKKTSEEFYNFLYSEKAKEIFKKYGYR
jgi:molybdate transport system substrate-binding protein